MASIRHIREEKSTELCTESRTLRGDDSRVGDSQTVLSIPDPRDDERGLGPGENVVVGHEEASVAAQPVPRYKPQEKSP